MADRDPPLLGDLKKDFSQIGADLGRIFHLRWQLARLELQAAGGVIKRLSVVLVAAAIMALVALPVLVVWVAGFLDENYPLARASWVLVVGLCLLSGAVLMAWLGWRRFRRRFVGLEESVEELHQDLVWLREWLGQAELGNEQSDGLSGE